MKNLEENNLSKVSGGSGKFIKGEDGLYYQVREGSGLTEEEKKIADVMIKLNGPMGDHGMKGPMRGHGMKGPMRGHGMKDPMGDPTMTGENPSD